MTADQDELIDTRTIWLPFDDGECAISVDLTAWNRAMRRVRASLDLLDDEAPAPKP